MNVWLAIYRISCAVLAVAVIAGLMEIFLPKIRENAARQKHISILEEQNRLKEEAARELRARRERFQDDPLYVERMAREKLGKIRPDEVIFRFTDHSTNSVPDSRASAGNGD
jgi:cell division protein FtsB